MQRGKYPENVFKKLGESWGERWHSLVLIKHGMEGACGCLNPAQDNNGVTWGSGNSELIEKGEHAGASHVLYLVSVL